MAILASESLPGDTLTLVPLGILSVGFNRFGSEQKLLEDPIHHLFEVYVEINRIITEEKEIEKKKAEDAGEKQVCPGLRTLYWLFLKARECLHSKEAKHGGGQTYNGPTDEEAKNFFVKMEHGTS